MGKMPNARVEDKKLTALFSEQELKDLEIENGSEFEIVKAKKGVYVFVEKPAEKKTQQENRPQIDEVEQRIIGYLKKKQPTDLVEGKFEKALSKEELAKFKEMLAQNRVEKFKSDPKYIKFIYKLKPQQVHSAARTEFENKEKPIEEFSLEKDGFMVFKNESMAQKISQEYGEQIKNGEIKGTRSFTGYFYIIDARLLDKSYLKIIDKIKQAKTTTAEELATQLNLTPTLVRISCTFLSEDGQILERRKDSYQLIE